MELAILSDTHIPGQAERLPEAFRVHVEDADHVIHAGDFGSHAALADVRGMAPNLCAVYGNADPLDIDLPAVAAIEVGGVTFVVSHGVVNFVQRAVFSSEGVVFDRDDWVDAVVETARPRAGTGGPIVGVGGHIHEVVDEMHDGVRVLNPGSATGVGPADGRVTMMLAEVAADEVDVTVKEA